MTNKRISEIAKRSIALVGLVFIFSATTGCHRLLSHGHHGHHGHHYNNSNYSSGSHHRSISSVVVHH